MKQQNSRLLVLAALLILAVAYTGDAPRLGASGAVVNVVRTPNGGIQPQVAVDRNGMTHLIYFKGDPSAGDIYYVRRIPGTADFSRPIQVNSVPGSAVAVGSVRGAQIATGKGGRVHVAWLGSSKAQPRGPDNATPMLYTRLNDAGNAFEPQRNVMQFAVGLDGGGSLAADDFGDVYVAWHGNPDKNGESHRRVYMARSSDDGKTFGRETSVYPEPTGACGCCGMRAFADNKGTLYILYRTATESIHRDMMLLVSKDRGKTFEGMRLAKWDLNACPMTTDAISQTGRSVLAAWETAGQVLFAQVRGATDEIPNAIVATGAGQDRKHPAVAENSRGDMLLAWTEGTAWERGGSIAWQVFDEHSRPTEASGTAPDLPVWGLVAALPNRDGTFTIIY